MQSKVAVITRTKNRPILLPRVRESVQSQTFKDYLWVLVNDAGVREPVDHEAEIARSHGVDVLVVHRDESTGMEAASNDGVRRTSSEYVIIHDDDDTWAPSFLEKTTAFLEANDHYVGVITHATQIIEKLTDQGPVFVSSNPYNAWMNSVCLIDLGHHNRFPPISYLFRRSLFDKIGGFDESLPVLGDWDFNLRSLMEGDIGVIPEMLANYHFRYEVHDQVYSNSVTGSVSKHVEYDAIYRNAKFREDMRLGRPGLGHVVNLGRIYGHIEHQIRRHDRRVTSMGRLKAMMRPRWLRKMRKLF